MIWRLIYDSEGIYSLFETNDITVTNKQVFDGNTIDECFSKIDELQLYCEYQVDNKTIIFSGGSRIIIIHSE